MNRRKNMKKDVNAATALMLAESPGAVSFAKNDEITMAVVGIHGQGKSHLRCFNAISGVRINFIMPI